ncbi:MAG TPA: Arc family DNA-binding protein [Acidimicrobiales bacterium]|nr:Arc family DNA-binding protein [Acidimicrobiales bacterium]
MASTYLRLDDELLEKMRQKAHSEHRSLNKAIVALIEEAVQGVDNRLLASARLGAANRLVTVEAIGSPEETPAWEDVRSIAKSLQQPWWAMLGLPVPVGLPELPVRRSDGQWWAADASGVQALYSAASAVDEWRSLLLEGTEPLIVSEQSALMVHLGAFAAGRQRKKAVKTIVPLGARMTDDMDFGSVVQVTSSMGNHPAWDELWQEGLRTPHELADVMAARDVVGPNDEWVFLTLDPTTAAAAARHGFTVPAVA